MTEDLEGKTIEEIEALMDNPVPEEVPAEPAEVPEPAAEEAPPPEPVASAEPEPPSDAEIMRAQMEALEAHAKKMEARLAGRESGEKGYIKQLQARIKALESGRPEPAETAEPEYAEAPEPAPRPRSTRPDSITAWAVQKAAQEAAMQFVQEHPDLSEINTEVQEYLRSSGYDAAAVLTSDDPIAASREVQRVMGEAYWHVKSERKTKAAADMQKRRADQMRGLEEAKRKATISASGSPPAPQPKPKTVEDMSLDDLERELNRLSKG